MSSNSSDSSTAVQPDNSPAARNASKQNEYRQYQRAYKACIGCRKRKAKCELLPDRTGPPCVKCRRELRECVFTAERAWTKRQKGNTPPMEDIRSPALPVNRDHALNGRISSDVIRGQSHHPSEEENRHEVVGMQVGGAGMAPPPPTPSQHRQPLPTTPSHESLEPNSRSQHPLRRPSSMTTQRSGLTHSVMRTIVSSGNDALNLLYEAANHEAGDSEDAMRHADASNAGPPQAADAYHGTPGSTVSMGTAPAAAMPVQVSTASSDVLRVWDACRFVKMGWFRSEEAVTYVDLFFKNLSPLSPIITDFYSKHENHFLLVTQDPLLCCTILMISSRYHVLPGIGGASRSYFIHHRLWEHCQHLIMRIMLGQEKASKAKTRTVGSVEALLLMSEWHPRSLHFPPAHDGWDSGLIMTVADERDEVQSPHSSSAKSWLEDVIEPARRSDRMSWMLLGCGLSLAHELGVFDDDNNTKGAIGETQAFIERTLLRRMRLRKLLYVFVEQLASRLGCTSMIPKSLNHSALQGVSAANMSSLRGAGQEWHFFMTAWIELTKLVKSISDMLFPSASFSRQILRNGRYIGLLEHFQPLLSQWRKKHLDPHKLGDSLQDMLDIEYQYVRIYANSLGMQAVVERTLEEADSSEGSPDEALAMSLDAADYEFIQEVVDGSCAILQKVIKLADNGALLFSPVRIFLRITTSAIYLLKGLSLGVWTKKLQTSLDILDRGIAALRSSTLDDMHLASRYATLLELHVARLRKSFVVSSRPPRLPTRPPSADRLLDDGLMGDALASNAANGTPGFAAFNGDNNVDEMLSGADDWLALPFDPSMAPFAPGDVPGFEDARLDFIWTLPS